MKQTPITHKKHHQNTNIETQTFLIV